MLRYNEYLSTFFIPDIPKIIGHRGASSLVPKNTLISTSTAARLKPKWVEVDVRLSADQISIILHGETLNGATNSKGVANKSTLKFLKILGSWSWFRKKFTVERMPIL